MLNLTDKSEGSVMLKSNGKKPPKKIAGGLKHIQNPKQGRPMYETQEDLDNEASVVEALSHTFKAAFDKLPISYGLDYFVTKHNTAIGVCEVKCRTIKHDAYPTYMLSLLKWNKGLQFHYLNQLRFSLVVRFTDGVYRYIFREEDLQNGIFYEFSGRTKTTRDSADLEPCVRIPIKLFQKVPLKNVT